MYRDEKERRRRKITHNELLSSFILWAQNFSLSKIKKQKSPFFNLTRKLFSLYSEQQSAYTKKKAIRRRIEEKKVVVERKEGKTYEKSIFELFNWVHFALPRWKNCIFNALLALSPLNHKPILTSRLFFTFFNNFRYENSPNSMRKLIFFLHKWEKHFLCRRRKISQWLNRWHSPSTKNEGCENFVFDIEGYDDVMRVEFSCAVNFSLLKRSVYSLCYIIKFKRVKLFFGVALNILFIFSFQFFIKIVLVYSIYFILRNYAIESYFLRISYWI